MPLSAVFKYMAKQAADCTNMVRVKVWHTHTIVWLLKNYSQRILTYNTRILLLHLTYGRTMVVSIPCVAWGLGASFLYKCSALRGSSLRQHGFLVHKRDQLFLCHNSR